MDVGKLKEDIQKHIKLSDNISVLESVDQLDIEKIADGILTVWVTWSDGYSNCVHLIKLLQDNYYRGQIIEIDNDSFSSAFQEKTFGRVALHGWGEIFVIKNGQIIKEFTGKESSINFKLYQDMILTRDLG